MPIGFTDADLDVIVRSAAPLAPEARSAFLADVARALDGRGELDGLLLARVCVEAQRRHWTPGLVVDGANY